MDDPGEPQPNLADCSHFIRFERKIQNMGAKDKKWLVSLSDNVIKNRKKLPKKVNGALYALSEEIKNKGPVRGNWLNYSKLGKKR